MEICSGVGVAVSALMPQGPFVPQETLRRFEVVLLLALGCVCSKPAAQWQFSAMQDVSGCVITYGRYTYFLRDSTHFSVHSESDLKSLLIASGDQAIQLNTFMDNTKWDVLLCADTINLAGVPSNLAEDYRSAIVSVVRISTKYDDWKNSSVAEIEHRDREVWIPVGDTLLPIKYTIPNQFVSVVNCSSKNKR